MYDVTVDVVAHVETSVEVSTNPPGMPRATVTPPTMRYDTVMMRVLVNVFDWEP